VKVKVWNAEAVRNGGPAPAEHELDEQQSLLLAALRGARGRALSYRDLQNAGVEYPASIVEELELAGLPVERANVGLTPGRAPIRGVRLAAGADSSATRHVHWYTTGLLPPPPSALRARVGHLAPPRSRAVVPALLLALAAAVAALVAVAATRTGPVRPHVLSARTRAAIRSRTPAVSPATTAAPQTAPPAASQAQPPAPAPAPAPATGQPSAAAPATPQSAGAPSSQPAAASDLEAQGHSLLESDHAAQAVPVLERAVAASGGSLQRCSEPAEEACLTYAYALYDLGSALRRSGRAAAAVPILELRLRIANQRPIVATELDRARREARA
jgi:hypothetical protein